MKPAKFIVRPQPAKPLLRPQPAKPLLRPQPAKPLLRPQPAKSILPPRLLVLDNGRQITEPFSRWPLIAMDIVALTVFSVRITGFDPALLVRRIKQFFVILDEMIPPDFSYLGNIFTPLFDTIKMSLLGSAIGSLLAIPAAILSAGNLIKNRAVIYGGRFLLSLVRTLPALVIALIATYIFGMGTLAGTVAIAVFTFAYVAKQLFEQIETVNMGAFEALEAAGAKRLPSFWVAISPQVMPTYIFHLFVLF